MGSVLLNHNVEAVDASKASAQTVAKYGTASVNKKRMVPAAIAALFLALLVNAISDRWLLTVPCAYEKKARLMDKARHTDVVTLGSSHGLFGIRPDFMSRSAINLANTSQPLLFDDQILTKVVSEPNNLKLAIIPVSYFSLYNDLISNREELRDPFYSRYMGVSQRNAWERLIDIRYSSLAAAYGANYLKWPLQGHRSFFDLPTLDDYGWGSRSQELAVGKISKSDGKARVRWHEKTMRRKFRPRNERAIEHMLTECKKRDISVLIVMMPVFSTYSDHVNTSRVARNVKYFSSLQTNSLNATTPRSAEVPSDYLGNHSASVRFANYFTDPRFTQKDFADNDHLNQTGAARFTRILEEEYISPMLLSSRGK